MDVPRLERHPDPEDLPEEGALLYVHKYAGERPRLYAARRKKRTRGDQLEIKQLTEFEH